FTYRVGDNELRIEQGIFIRKKRYISINRIHKIDVTADVFHGLFKLVKVQIDTAGSGDGAEVDLSAIQLTKAAKLRRALQKGKSILASVIYCRKHIRNCRIFTCADVSCIFSN